MKSILFFLILFLAHNSAFAQTFRLDSVPTQQPIYPNEGWKWHAGDNLEWAKKDIDDSRWEDINPFKPVYYLPQLRKSDNGWLRLSLVVDSALVNKSITILLYQVCATELFLDGKIIGQLGTVGDSTKKEETYFVYSIPQTINITFEEAGLHTLAIRYSFNRQNINHFGWFSFLSIAFSSSRLALEEVNTGINLLELSSYIAGILLLLFILFIFFYRLGNKSNFNLNVILYSLFTVLSLFTFNLFGGLQYSHAILNNFFCLVFIFLFEIFFLNALYILFYRKRGIIFYGIILIQIVLLSGVYMLVEPLVMYMSLIQSIPFILVSAESLRICFLSIQKKQKGAIIIFWGQIMTIIGYLGFYLGSFSYLIFEKSIQMPPILESGLFIMYMTSSSIAFAYLIARDFVDNSKSLKNKIIEVENLSAEKQQILAAQNELLEQQVEARTTELKASQAQLIQSEKMASLGELTAGIAHEIQNPLNFVNNYSEVNVELMEELSEELENGNVEEAKYIVKDLVDNEAKIYHHGQRADAIVRGMLQHSRTNSGTKEPTDLNRLADEYLRLAYQSIRAKDKSFEMEYSTDFDESIPFVEVVPQDMGRALLNIINNAFQAVAERKQGAQMDYLPKVNVATRNLCQYIELTVKDNGNGIPEAIRDKIFQPFFTTKPTGQGTGLGLSLAYESVRAHGGTLELISAEGGGAEFVIKIPT